MSIGRDMTRGQVGYGNGVIGRFVFGKSEPLKTKMRDDEAKQVVARYGDRGPLPANLNRDERMRAYEGRYVHGGGRKGEHWQRRADVADKVKAGGLAGATAAGAAYLPLESRRLEHKPRIQRLKRSVALAGLAAGTVSGAGELYAGHARRKRASYANAPAGVAASALRRMRDYTPQ